MRFECPATLGDQDLYMIRPLQYNWNTTDVGPDSSKFDRTLWDSHLSMRRKYYFPERQGIDLADLYVHRRFFEDVTTRTADGAHLIQMGTVHAGALTYVPPSRLDQCNGTLIGDLPPEEMLHRAQSTVHP
jgi:hypothetical protein